VPEMECRLGMIHPGTNREGQGINMSSSGAIEMSMRRTDPPSSSPAFPSKTNLVIWSMSIFPWPRDQALLIRGEPRNVRLWTRRKTVTGLVLPTR
jgi:hypothetical protein